jgi:hypothetical protein
MAMVVMESVFITTRVVSLFPVSELWHSDQSTMSKNRCLLNNIKFTFLVTKQLFDMMHNIRNSILATIYNIKSNYTLFCKILDK